jgi:hypothetical protein
MKLIGTGMSHDIKAHVAALTEKHLIGEAQRSRRSAPRHLSATVLIPQPT